MEVSLLSALMAIYSAGLKVSRFIRQEQLENYHVFRGGDHDLILIPVSSSHALLLAGRELAKADRILQTVEGMLFVRGDVENVLESLGVAPAAMVTESTVPEVERDMGETIPSPDVEPEVDLDALFASAGKKTKVKDLDAFWNEAVEKSGSLPINPDVISYEEARKLGLAPGKGATIPTKTTGSLKKK
jgi:hypothetical protein